MSCCGARHLPAAAKRLGICRPLPLAHLASSATGGGRIAPHRHVFLTAFRITHSISGWIMGFVCIFAFGENKGFARSSPREQRSPALHLIVRIPSSNTKVIYVDTMHSPAEKCTERWKVADTPCGMPSTFHGFSHGPKKCH